MKEQKFRNWVAFPDFNLLQTVSNYSESPILHHHVDLTEKLYNQEKCNIIEKKENRRPVFLTALVLFIIKIKFTQYSIA